MPIPGTMNTAASTNCSATNWVNKHGCSNRRFRPELFADPGHWRAERVRVAPGPAPRARVLGVPGVCIVRCDPDRRRRAWLCQRDRPHTVDRAGDALGGRGLPFHLWRAQLLYRVALARCTLAGRCTAAQA